MTTDELIKALRLCSNNCNYHCGIGEKEYDPCPDCPANHMDAPLCLHTVIHESADRLEELDERVAIMGEGKAAQWVEEPDRVNHWHCSRCGRTEGMAHMTMRYCPGCGAIMEEGKDI